MAILSPSDQSTYFPNVTATGNALAGLLALSQAICEGEYGANRSLEAQAIEEILSTRVHSTVFLSYRPVLTINSIAIRSMRDQWGRQIWSDWMPVETSAYFFDPALNRLTLYAESKEVKAHYTTGFDFSTNSRDVQSIKAIAGVVVDWAARRHYGQLDAYLVNPSEPGSVAESFNYVRPDQYLQALLLPLKKYVPRGGVA